MLPGILNQLGPEGLNQLKRLANNVVANKSLNAVPEEDDVPNLVENFEEVSQKEEAAKSTKVSVAADIIAKEVVASVATEPVADVKPEAKTTAEAKVENEAKAV